MTTSSVAPIWNFTSGGRIDSTMAPTSQNQLTTSEPHHSRGSARRCLSSAPVETKMLRLMTRFGAPSPVCGMNRLATQHQRRHHHQPGKVQRIAAAARREATNDGAEQDGEECRAFDQRVAGGQFLALEMVGKDAVLDRPK